MYLLSLFDVLVSRQVQEFDSSNRLEIQRKYAGLSEYLEEKVLYSSPNHLKSISSSLYRKRETLNRVTRINYWLYCDYN